MSLIRLVSPESDTEIIAIVALLEAHDIPCYVRGGGFGGLLPGVQINGLNTRTIMVAEEQLDLALELLRDFRAPAPASGDDVAPKGSGTLRNLLEFFLFGWFVPGSRGRVTPTTGGKPEQRSGGP